MEKSIIIMIAAHFLGDFLLQPDWLVRRKKQLLYLPLHGFIHAALIYGLYQAWSNWALPLAVFIVHTSIDAVKQSFMKDTARTFAWDQVAHLASLLVIAWTLTTRGWMCMFNGSGYSLIVGIAALVATVEGAGRLVAKVVMKIKEENNLEIKGLMNGGALIGSLERALIFLFIFISEPAGIGFLVAAKSILRFEEAKNQGLAEYVLIGTLLSFSLAIAIAWAAHWAIGL